MIDMNDEQKNEDTTMVFRGIKGGKGDEDGFIRMGVYAGNLWGMAMGHREDEHYRNSMLISQFASYGIPIELAPLFYEAKFEKLEDGLHGQFTFKDVETMQKVKKCMIAQRDLNESLRDLGHRDYTNEKYVELGRLRDKVVEVVERNSYFYRILLHRDTTIRYTYVDDDGEEYEDHYLDDPSYYAWNLLQVYEEAGGKRNFEGDEEE
jgi:hypothetical protein